MLTWLSDRSRNDGARSRKWLRLARREITDRERIVAALLFAIVGYFVAFLAAGRPGGDALRASLRNLVALVFVSIPFGWLIRAHVRRIGGLAELLLHCLMASLFAFFWYFVLMVMIGLGEARSVMDFDVRPIFPTRAATWQISQGLLVYAVLALVLESRPASAARTASTPAMPRRYFIKRDGDALPIDLAQVVLVRGSDNYSEIVSSNGSRRLARLTLDRFLLEVGQGDFCRIHRSIIVNVRHIDRFEPDGSGRMIVWMDNGEALRTSRSGAALLRERLI